MDWYRSVLEVHKYLPATDILTNTSTVHSVWMRASDATELWAVLCDRLEPVCISVPLKSAYRLHAFSSVRLTCVGKHTLQFFNCVTTQWEPPVSLSQKIPAEFCSSAGLLSDGTVFLCGGSETNASNRYDKVKTFPDSYRIQQGGVVTTLQPMSAARVHHGLIEVGGAVYVFGGKPFPSPFKEGLCTCERWPIPTHCRWETVPWEGLPDVPRPVWGFNPCSHGLNIYLYAYYPVTIYAFDTVTRVYSEWATVPGFNAAQQASLVIHSQNLVVLQTEGLATLQWESSYGKVTDCTMLNVFANGVVNPVLVGSIVYQLDYASGAVFCVDVDTKKTTKMYKRPVPGTVE